MEVNEDLLSFNDWEKLLTTAEEIIKNATRDLILWTEVRKQVKTQMEKLADIELINPENLVDQNV